jgi:hypothetical protein
MGSELWALTGSWRGRGNWGEMKFCGNLCISDQFLGWNRVGKELFGGLTSFRSRAGGHADRLQNGLWSRLITVIWSDWEIAIQSLIYRSLDRSWFNNVNFLGGNGRKSLQNWNRNGTIGNWRLWKGREIVQDDDWLDKSGWWRRIARLWIFRLIGKGKGKGKWCDCWKLFGESWTDWIFSFL